MSAINKFVRFSVFLLAIISVWWIAVTSLEIPQYIFPGPLQVFERFVEGFAIYVLATMITLSEAAVGLSLALVATTCVGIVFALSREAERYMSPVLVAMQSIPILSIAPLLTMWFGTGFSSKAVAAFVVCFFPLAAGWSSGIRAVRQDERDLFKTMGASRAQVAFRLVAPRALPFCFSGFRVATPLSILGAIVGEFVGAQNGLGFLILSHSYYARTADIFVCIFIIALSGIISHHAVGVVEKRVLFWRAEERG